MLAKVAPEIIVNAAAYTAVDKSEEEPKLAFSLSRDLPAALGTYAAGNGALVVQFSTDYVFDGTATTPYREDDSTQPLVGSHRLDKGQVGQAHRAFLVAVAKQRFAAT